MNVIEFIDLTKVYRPRMKKGGIVAVDCLSLAIGQGQIFGLLGPNGAGKTTLFKALLGVAGITSGEAL
ncbi:MAG: ATP-binding cassette domain-containing protein, partial [candidate division Zixibacteria bacterium]|nr:ATP-binding cassette domain-containing protein [candidate division Zixibacteria bacterium]